MAQDSFKPETSKVEYLEDVGTEREMKPFDLSEGYVVDSSEVEVGARQLKLANNGHTVLIPQPSDDPEDPLNWSRYKKHLFLFIIAASAFLPDYGSAVGAVTLLPQAQIWGLSPDTVNHSAVGNVFMLGAGGVIVVMLAAYFGRAPILFWFLVMALATAIWCAAAQSFQSFMAARILSGFFSTVAQGGGLMFINDLFFFHERVRKINIWSAFVILSPFLSPLITAFILTTQPWQVAFWLYVALTGFCLVLTILLMDETYYDRRLAQDAQPPKHSRLMRLVGVEQFRSRRLRNSFFSAIMRSIKVIMKPTVFISVLYYLLIFSWSVGINTTLSIFLQPLYNFGYKQIGFFYFTPIVGGLLGEIAGHWLHDIIAKRYMKKHHGHFEPEVRLRAIYVSTPFLVTGLVVLGFSLERKWHYMCTSVGWGFYVFGIMVTTVAVNAYNLDSYAEGSGEVAAWVNFSRTTGGFIISYFQVKWAAASGTIISFGAQGAICFAAFGLVVLLQLYGKKVRQRSGPLHFHTT
ncbi:major facilitator superfamily domain-containing protein [Lipomyces doorenjongii]